MPRVPVYTAPRADIHFRIYQTKYDAACKRAKALGFPTLNKYLEHLLDDDLLLESIEKRQALLDAEKKRSD